MDLEGLVSLGGEVALEGLAIKPRSLAASRSCFCASIGVRARSFRESIAILRESILVSK